jgi:presenilin-like A22 family membrane protease
LSTAYLQLSPQFPRGINTGSNMNSLPRFIASQKMRILLFNYLCNFGIFLHHIVYVNGHKRTNSIIWYICLFSPPSFFRVHFFLMLSCSFFSWVPYVVSHLQKYISWLLHIQLAVLLARWDEWYVGKIRTVASWRCSSCLRVEMSVCKRSTTIFSSH